MTTTRVLSKNAVFQKFIVLKTNRYKRYSYGTFLVEGVRNINEAVACGFKIQAWLYPEGRQLSGWARDLLRTVTTEENYALAPALMEELSGKDDTSELMAIAAMRNDALDVAALSDNPILLLLDRPSNRGNLGTILRTADALGVEAVLLTGHSVDLYDPEVLAASMGSFFRVPAVRVASHADITQALSQLRSRFPSLVTVGTTAHDAVPIYEANLSGPAVLLIGNETDGLSRILKETCDVMATIPMQKSAGASSLNIACATTVLVYEALSQRRTAP